jgi:alcohol dehydrogenase
MREPRNVEARHQMLFGAHLAGAAIENSMLGAAHACANPLTAVFGIPHGVAVGIMLPHVIQFNAAGADGNPYESLLPNADALVRRVESLLDATRLDRRLTQYGVTHQDLPALALMAAGQWTLAFNPRRAGVDELRNLYELAM